MPFDMDEFGGSAEEAALANPPEPVDPRTQPQGVQGVARPPNPQPIIANAAEIVATMLGQRPPAAPPRSPIEHDYEEQPDDNEYMSEVEARLDVAAHYQLLLRDTFFQTNSRAARQVTNELRVWVKERLAELVGMSNPKKLQLSDETVQILSELTPAQIYALRSVADRLLAGGFTAPTSSTPAPVAPPKPKAPAAPALVKRGTGTAPQQVSAPPQLQPTTEQPPQRGPGRPPGSKNKKHAQVDNPNKIKFPGSNSEMSAATFMAASLQADRTVNRNPILDKALAMPPTPGTVVPTK